MQGETVYSQSVRSRAVIAVVIFLQNLIKEMSMKGVKCLKSQKTRHMHMAKKCTEPKSKSS